MVTMDANAYFDIIQHFDPTSVEQRKALEKITYQYPYFQPAYAHYLKTLKAQDQFNYTLILRKTAVLTPDRAHLERWLQEESIPVISSTAAPTPAPADISANPTEAPQSTKASPSSTNTPEEETPAPKAQPTKKSPSKKVVRQEKEKQKTPVASPSVPPVEPEQQATPPAPPLAMPFEQWVVYSNKGKVSPVEQPLATEDKFSRIDQFLANNPKIPPVRKDQPKIDLASHNAFNKDELMTETLAKVYVDQKKYKKARYAYKILSLKYPEKNSFFADQIKRIKQLEQNS